MPWELRSLKRMSDGGGNGVVSGMPAVCPMTHRAVVEAQFVTALIGDSASIDVSEGGVA